MTLPPVQSSFFLLGYARAEAEGGTILRPLHPPHKGIHDITDHSNASRARHMAI